LLQIFFEAPNDDRLTALVSFTRPALDYLFFQTLTERIEKASREERSRLEALREKLLEITRRIDKRMEEEYKKAAQLLDTILKAENIQQATAEHLPEINDRFVEVLNQATQEAQRKNDAERMSKLQQVVAVLQQASAPPPEIELLQELLDAPDAAELERRIAAHASEITPEFSTLISSIISRMEEEQGNSENAQMIPKLEAIYRAVLKFTMKQNLAAS